LIFATRSISRPYRTYCKFEAYRQWSRSARTFRIEESSYLCLGIVLLHRMVPLLLSTLEQCVAVPRQNIFLLDQTIHCIAVELEISLATGVSLRYAFARIARLLAFFGSFCEENVQQR